MHKAEDMMSKVDDMNKLYVHVKVPFRQLIRTFISYQNRYYSVIAA